MKVAASQKKVTSPSQVEVIKTKTAQKTIRVDERLLHSAYDPEKEAKRFVEAQNLKKGDLVIFYGIGLGYFIQPVLDLIGPKGQLLVIECHPEIIAAFLSYSSEKSRQENVLLITGNTDQEVSQRLLFQLKELRPLFKDYQQKVVIHPASYQSMPKHFYQLKQVLDLILVERKNPEIFDDLQKKNVKKNLLLLLSSPSLNEVKNVFSGKPAIFVNAGPSLDDSFLFLKQIQKNAFLFCSDTVYSILIKKGIRPDVVFSVDPQEESLKHFDEVTEEALLIGIPTADPQVFEGYPGSKLMVFQKDSRYTKKMEAELTNQTKITSGGSVSCIGLEIIDRLGCEPIFFVGMDYAFDQEQFYAKETVESMKWFEKINRFQTIEMQNRTAIGQEETLLIRGETGELLRTNQTLYLYYREIQDYIRSNQKKNFFKLSKRGAHFEGVRVLPMKKAQEKYLENHLDKKCPIRYHSVDKKQLEHLLSLLG